jgi:hypothetical protein
LPHFCPFLKLRLLDASVPSFVDRIQRWKWQYHTRSVQCFAAVALTSCNLAHPACFRKALRTLLVHTERTVMFPFCTSNVMRSVRTSPLVLSSEISRPSSARVSARSMIGSPRCDFTLSRKVALPARTRCVSRQTISRRTSASGAVASVAFPPYPTNFLMAHKTAALSHSSRTSALRAADFNAHTTTPNSSLFELVPSSFLPTRAHLSASSPWNSQHPDPILPSLQDPSTPNNSP